MNIKLTLPLVAGALLGAPAFAQTLYVDANLTSGAGDGSSWSNAFQGDLGLQAALAAAVSGNDIFVADGTYRTVAPGGNRATTIRLQNGVEIYGGFEGGEANLAARPAIGAFPSILSGDIQGNDSGAGGGLTDNAYHVVGAGTTNSTNSTAVLDGFLVVGGFANGSGNNDRGAGILCLTGNSPTIRNTTFRGNRCTFGGGAGYVNGAPSFEDCRFEDNIGGSFGGAFDIAQAGAVSFDRCVFTGNSASRAGALEIFATSNAFVRNCFFKDNVATGGSGGGALWLGNGGTTRVQNCTIVENSASANAAGGIRNQGASPIITNCILWGNIGPGGAMAAANQVTAGANVDFCIVMGGFAGGNGNLSADPMFTDAMAGDYTIGTGSPAVDAGDNTALAASVTVDLAGLGRYQDDPMTPNTGAGAGAIDIGAFEYQAGSIGIGYCAGAPNSFGQIGSLTATGSDIASVNDVTLQVGGLPPSQFALFVGGQTQGFTPNAGGSIGTLCLGGAIGRFQAPGQIMSSSAAGTITLPINLNALPTPTGTAPVTAGQTWNFQAWYRDSILGIPTSNFTDALSISFQ